MNLYDTQIISYDFKGSSALLCYEGRISAITALEFLLVQSQHPTKARYYIPRNRSTPHHFSMLEAHRHHPFQKRSTDQVLMDLGTAFPQHIEFCNLAVTDTINSRQIDLFDAAIKFQEKDERKILKRRFAYLIERQIQCLALTPDMIQIAFILLSRFLEKHAPKQNFRNTLNDMLIFATALDQGVTLTTEDSLLLRFVATQRQCSVKQHGNFVRMDITKKKEKVGYLTAESKGYINRGWSFKIRK